jgi:hypothetical protein
MQFLMKLQMGSGCLATCSLILPSEKEKKHCWEYRVYFKHSALNGDLFSSCSHVEETKFPHFTSEFQSPELVLIKK